jgi:hypothetical protein
MIGKNANITATNHKCGGAILSVANLSTTCLSTIYLYKRVFTAVNVNAPVGGGSFQLKYLEQFSCCGMQSLLCGIYFTKMRAIAVLFKQSA